MGIEELVSVLMVLSPFIVAVYLQRAGHYYRDKGEIR